MKSNKFWIFFDYVSGEYLDRAIHFNSYIAPVSSLEIELWWFRFGIGVDWRNIFKK